MSRLQQHFGLRRAKNDCKEVERQDVVVIARKSVAAQFGDNALTRIGGARDYIVGFGIALTAHLHCAVEIPQIVIAKDMARGRATVTTLPSGAIHRCTTSSMEFSDLLGSLDEVEPNDLILLADRDNGVIGYTTEHPFTDLQDLQLRTAMRAGASAKAVGQYSVALPRVAALRAGDDTLCRPAADVVEAMMERMVPLHFGDTGQTAAQSCHFDLYLCLRFHDALLSIKIGSFDC